MIDHEITLKDIRKAHSIFSRNEPRDLFYRAASELVGNAFNWTSSLTLAEALAVLLQTWNQSYYRFRKFDAAHFHAIEILLERHFLYLRRLRKRDIEEAAPKEKPNIVELFEAFEMVLGPVGAAKALHLLAPRFFPLWDRKIAVAYGGPLRVAGMNGEKYWRFLLIAQGQCRRLRHRGHVADNPLKAIDEYNYCKYTKGWIS